MSPAAGSRYAHPQVASTAFAVTVLESAGTDTDAADYTTASVNPGTTTDAVYLAAIGIADGGNVTQDPTCSGMGGSWTKIGTGQLESSNTARLVVFRASGALTTGAVTFTGVVSSGTADGAQWQIIKVAGINTASNNGVVQSAKNTSATTSLSVTLSAFVDAVNNVACGFFESLAFVADATITQGSGFTMAQYDQTQIIGGAFAHGLGFEYKVGQDTTVDVTSVAAGLNGIALELDSVL